MKRGPKPKGNVLIKWSPEFAYAIGLIVADGCVQKDGRHIDFTSVDRNLAVAFRDCLNLRVPVKPKRSGSGRRSYHIQFSDVLFHSYLQTIGITPAKSKAIGAVLVPSELFSDFTRGYFDGDGSTYGYPDPVYPRSYRFCVSFTAASEPFLTWLQHQLNIRAGVKGYLCRNRNNSYVQLKYGKHDSLALCGYMYANPASPRLKRKYLKIIHSARIIGLTPRW